MSIPQVSIRFQSRNNLYITEAAPKSGKTSEPKPIETRNPLPGKRNLARTYAVAVVLAVEIRTTDTVNMSEFKSIL